MRLLYNLGILLTDAAIHAAALFHGKARLWVRGRKGIFQKMSQSIGPSARIAWFHAASLGEFEQGRPVIEAFRKEKPDYKILVTFFSPSGYEIRKNYSGADYVFYLPSDRPRNVRRFMAIVRPEIAVFIKYEFWVNYLLAIKQAGTRLYLISSIFRPEQIFFKPYGGLFRRALSAFRHIFVQNVSSVELLKGIGMEAVSVAGDTRFDRVCDIAQQAKDLPVIESFAAGNAVMVAGSTWPPDEELLLPLIERYSDVKFIIVPHEIDIPRIEKFQARLTRLSLRYTQLMPHSPLKEAGVLFIDTIGLLSSIYRYGRWGYIGGGFGAGIHNTLEAAVFGLPLVFGPRYEKFQEARDLVEIGGAVSVCDENQLDQWFIPLYDNPERSRQCGDVCRNYVFSHKGATRQIINKICR